MLDQAQRPDAAPKLVALAREATQAAEALLAEATAAVRQRVTVDDRMVDGLLDREQRATHGLAWLATYVEAVRQLAAYAERMHAGGGLGEIEELLVEIGIGEYLAQIQGGIPMSQGEIVRPADIGLAAEAVAARLRRAAARTDRCRQCRAPRAPGRADARAPWRHRRRLRARRDAGDDPRRDAQVRRQRGRRRRRSSGTAPTATSRSMSSRRCPSSACSASPSRKSTAAWASARNRCASSPRSSRAAISGSARSARAPRSPPS